MPFMQFKLAENLDTALDWNITGPRAPMSDVGVAGTHHMMKSAACGSRKEAGYRLPAGTSGLPKVHLDQRRTDLVGRR